MTKNEFVKSLSDAHARAILLFLSRDAAVFQKMESFTEELERLRDMYPKSRSAICLQCDSAFILTKNGKRGCTFHNGKLFLCCVTMNGCAYIIKCKGVLNPDYESDIWADHDEDCHGPIDTVEMRRDCPDGFVWSCCEKTGPEEGCTEGYHNAEPDMDRTRYF